jgi:hypothetical protein
MEGIQVIRVWTYITANNGFLRRIFDYVSFMLSATLAAPFVEKADVVIGTSPQFFTACAAFLVSRMKRIPFIFELRDMWPESIKAVGAMLDSPAIRCLERIELFLYRKAEVIVTVTHSFKRKLIERGIDDRKIEVVTNGVDLTRFTPAPRDETLARQLGIEGCFVAGYIGTHGLAHGLETLLAGAEMLQNEHRDDLRLLFLGDGARKVALKAEAERLGLRNVVFVDSVPKAEVPRYWSLLDLSIIHLRDSELFATVIPSKIFESMAMGIPLVHGVPGESADIVRREGAGIIFPSGDAKALRDALVALQEDRSAYEQFRTSCLASAPRYDRKRLATTMLTIIEGVYNRHIARQK